MNRTSPLFICRAAAIVLSAGCLALAAQSETGSRDIVIEHPAALPQQAQAPGIAFKLFTESGDGSAYLYIEQQNGRQLTILNVTDPAHVAFVRTVDLAVSGPFDFAQPLSESAMLLRFRSTGEEAVLDLRQPKNPSLTPLRGSPYSAAAQPLGDSTLLTIDDQPQSADSSSYQTPLRDVQIIDKSTPAHPVVLSTASQVSGVITRDATGTTFLLGAEGLTIVRRPRVELEYKLQQSAVS